MRTLLVVAVLAVGAAPQDDVVKKIVPNAEKVKKLVKKISPQAKDKIEKALGEKLDPTDLTPSLWECYTTVPRVSPNEKTRCLVTVVPVKMPKGVVRVGVAVAALEKTVHLVKILENPEDKALESRLFLSQFDGFETSESLYSPPSALEDALKKTQGGNDDAKEQEAVVRVNVLMHALGPSWERMMDRIDKKDKAAAEDLDEMMKAFDECVALLPVEKFFKATKQEKFKAFAVGAKSDATELRKLLDSGKFEDAFKKTADLDRTGCAKCHAAYRMEFRTEREKRSLGNGYFSTKLEVASPDRNLQASYQLVATGIRKAILLAVEAK
jgi:hypothetical protein